MSLQHGSEDPYLNSSGVLLNKLGITDEAKLAQAEADISAVQVARLSDGKHIPGKYDLPHLQKFHKFIFGDIYPWAGEIRTVNIYKERHFAFVHAIPGYSEQVFGDLKKANFLKGRGREEFTAGLVKTYCDINALHPFREGNGRSQRAFLSQLARDAGYDIQWSRMDAKRNIETSVLVESGKAKEEEAYGALLGPLITPLKKDESKSKSKSAMKIAKSSANKKPKPGASEGRKSTKDAASSRKPKNSLKKDGGRKK